MWLCIKSLAITSHELWPKTTALYLKPVVVDGMVDGKGGENGGSAIYSFVNYSLWQDQDALLMSARERVKG